MYKEQLIALVPVLEKQEHTLLDETDIFVRQYVRWLIVRMIDEENRNKQAIYVTVPWMDDIHDRDSTLSSMRQQIILWLIEKWFTGFMKRPYVWWTDHIVTTHVWQYVEMQTDNMFRDDIDRWIQTYIWSGNTWEEIRIDISTWSTWSDVLLFKETSDIAWLGYSVVSHRKRFNNDQAYRRFNIATAFEKIWPVRVINPGETLSYLDTIQFDADNQHTYLSGKVIYLDEEIDEYGGWLCGGSTAVYQWVVLNKALVTSERNHSKWYSDLYEAEINGELLNIPGIDSTIYSPSLDLRITNTASYPIVLVMNYDGSVWWVEEVFTLWRSTDRGRYEFLDERNKSYTIETKDGNTREVTGRCYERDINGEISTRCYKELF